MSAPLQLRELYTSVFKKLQIGPAETSLLEKIMAGAEKGDDYEECLRIDPFFTKTILQHASQTMRNQVAQSVSHGVVLLGKESIRDMVFGHTIERIVTKDADKKFKSIVDAAKPLTFAIKAEEHARKCGNEYTGIAFAGGFLFDIFRNWAAKDPDAGDQVTAVIDAIWKHSLRTAAIAWLLANHPRVLISHRKITYVGGLLHDLGKVALACAKPAEYLSCYSRMKEAQHRDPTDDIYDIDIERSAFQISHPEVGALIAFSTGYLREIESLIDFHHDFLLLKKRDPNLFLLAVIINISDRIAYLWETKAQMNDTDLGPIVAPHKAYFPLTAIEILNTVMVGRSRGLLS